MKTLHFLPTLLLALSLAATAQTTPVPQQTTTVTEDLDPATGKVIRRTTRTTTEPVTTTATPTTATPAPAVDAAPATDAVVSAFLNKKTTVSTLSAAELPTAYERLLNKVHNERQGWQPAPMGHRRRRSQRPQRPLRAAPPHPVARRQSEHPHPAGRVSGRTPGPSGIKASIGQAIGWPVGQAFGA